MENEDFEPPLVGAAGVTMVLRACGRLNEQRLAFVGERFLQIRDFLVIQPKDVAGMVANLAWIPTNQGGAKIGIVIMMRRLMLSSCGVTIVRGRVLNRTQMCLIRILSPST